ncbi:hypothetical protein [Alicyclobacillus sp. SO9]|uniref:hypothetical protein n=1 Tax=Alicyclobacillus sp. SO9 TaxID=2665646 RepID=UPI0018E8F5A8|nr:hypothetical protein [Alicyclobacillus sp. SO9]QQE79168.1 hypothetical protein GI364_01215 [Alicyclobacillus sp. SO9]
MTTVKVRAEARELIRTIAQKEDHETLTLDVRSLKNLVELLRDYAIITHASDAQSEVAVAAEKLIDYVDLNDEPDIEESAGGTFKTTYLASVFGVSVTAINNWIDEGRFVGYHRARNKHARIPHITPFRHRDGRVEPLGHIINRYRHQENESFADDDEKAMLIEEIKSLKQKYGGKDFEEAFNFEAPTSDQESDLSRWRFYRERLKEL